MIGSGIVSLFNLNMEARIAKLRNDFQSNDIIGHFAITPHMIEIKHLRKQRAQSETQMPKEPIIRMNDTYRSSVLDNVEVKSVRNMIDQQAIQKKEFMSQFGNKVGKTVRPSRNYGDGVKGCFTEASPVSVRARERSLHESTSVKSLLSEQPMTAVKITKCLGLKETTLSTDNPFHSIWKDSPKRI